jgi:hypothetical protein
MPGFIQHQAFLAAIEWKSANIEGDVKEHPVTINNPTSWGSVARTIKNLDPLRQIVVKDENPETRRSFQTHIETILSNLLIVDGTLFEGCAEPVYVVHSFPGHTVIRVETEENATYSRTAIFPLGKFDEARAFAAENTPEDEIYTDNISELEDCGQSIGNDTELRSLVAAARSARDHYVQKYTNTYAPNVMALIEDVPISSITLYRKLSAIVRQYDAIGHADADEVAQTLRDAAADPLASVFTDGGRLPLEAVADLWDDRAVHIPIGVASPRP